MFSKDKSGVLLCGIDKSEDELNPYSALIFINELELELFDIGDG